MDAEVPDNMRTELGGGLRGGGRALRRPERRERCKLLGGERRRIVQAEVAHHVLFRV